MAKGYEVFERVQGVWERIAGRPTIHSAVRFADLRREHFPAKSLRIMTAPRGRVVADLPARRAA